MIRDLFLLEIFINIAETLSFSKTASNFNASQSFISKKVSQLESELQTSLFIRTTRTVELSESGKKILPIATKVLEESSSLSKALTKNMDDKDVSGNITISSSETYAIARLVPFISKFTNVYPNISINLKLSNEYYDLAKNHVDFVFRIGNLPDSSLKSIKIENNDLLFCTNPELHKKIKPNIKIEELRQYKVIYLPFHGENTVIVGKKSLKLKNVFNRPNIVADSGEVINRLAITSDRVALRSSWDIKRYIQQGKLKVIQTSDKIQSNTSVYVLYAQRDYLPQKMKIFLNYIRKELMD